MLIVFFEREDVDRRQFCRCIVGVSGVPRRPYCMCKTKMAACAVVPLMEAFRAGQQSGQGVAFTCR